MERFREILKMREKSKTVPLSSKMLGPDEDEEDNKLVDIIKKYFVETSIHGPKYIFENKRHSFERLFWIVAVTFMASCGFFLIYQVGIHSELSKNLIKYQSLWMELYMVKRHC